MAWGEVALLHRRHVSSHAETGRAGRTTTWSNRSCWRNLRNDAAIVGIERAGRALLQVRRLPNMVTSDDSLPIYLDEIGAISLLTADEERSLARTVACGKEVQRQLVAVGVAPEAREAAAHVVARGDEAR